MNMQSSYYGAGDPNEELAYNAEMGGGNVGHQVKVQRLLNQVRQYQRAKAQQKGTTAQNEMDREEEEKMNKRKIGPFSFDIDDEIDTEILTSEEVYKDLRELEDILAKQEESDVKATIFTRSKKKKSSRF